jgi:pilus assembly protein CpaB
MLLRIFAAALGCIGLLGIGLAWMAVQTPAPPVQQAAVPSAITPLAQPKTDILIAARPLRAGTLVVPDDLASVPVDVGQEPKGSYRDSVATRTALVGAMVRHSLSAKDAIVSLDVLVPGDRGFLAAVLGPGMRAVTVGVDQISGTAGLIWPGDRVDLILTQTIDEKGQPLDRRVSGELALADLRVIAVDQDLVEGGQATVTDRTTAANNNRTVTLEASPFDAERIAVASRIGRISLVVRSATEEAPAPSDNSKTASPAPSQPSAPTIAWAGDVSPALRQTPTRNGSVIRVYRGKDVEEVPF